jgi:hypothetical protein
MRLGRPARARAVFEARLVSERSRLRLAASVDRFIDRAEHRRRGSSAAIPVSDEAAHHAGPMYVTRWPGELRRAANGVCEALDGRGAGG